MHILVHSIKSAALREHVGAMREHALRSLVSAQSSAPLLGALDCALTRGSVSALRSWGVHSCALSIECTSA